MSQVIARDPKIWLAMAEVTRGCWLVASSWLVALAVMSATIAIAELVNRV